MIDRRREERVRSAVSVGTCPVLGNVHGHSIPSVEPLCQQLWYNHFCKFAQIAREQAIVLCV